MMKFISGIAVAAFFALPAFAAEQGSGFYAENCERPHPGYDIKINRHGTATVGIGSVTYNHVETSYSFFGEDTPSDFLIALLFNRDANPLPDYKGQSGWIEIWKGENAYYALENGRASKELYYCGRHSSAAEVEQLPRSPYTTAEYDATTYLPCSLGNDSHDQSCPAGIYRGDYGSSSIRVMSPSGSERFLNFDSGDVTTPDGGDLTWGLDGDTWYIGIDNYEYYIVPDAAINGG